MLRVLSLLFFHNNIRQIGVVGWVRSPFLKLIGVLFRASKRCLFNRRLLGRGRATVVLNEVIVHLKTPLLLAKLNSYLIHFVYPVLTCVFYAF